jgi:hypothetical protein
MQYSKLVNKILKEMSAPWPDYTETESYLDAAKVPEHSTPIGIFSLSGQKYSVYEYRYKNKAASIYVTNSNKKMMMTIRLAIYENDNHIQISSIQKHKDAKFYYSDFIKKVLLKRYSYMVSDDSHTKASFAMYKRLASDPEVDLRVVDKRLPAMRMPNPDEIPINSGEELQKYYGVGLEHFVYKVSLN